MIIEFMLIWMLGKELGMGILFWILFTAWVAYRVLKEMIERSPEMEDK